MLSTFNRNEAFHTVVDKLPEKRKQVYLAIKEKGRATALEISLHFMKPINEVTGRITELKELCLIKESGSSKNNYTRCNNTLYSVCSDEERIDLINSKYQDLIDRRDALVNDYNLNLSDYTKEYLVKQISSIDSKINKLKEIQ